MSQRSVELFNEDAEYCKTAGQQLQSPCNWLSKIFKHYLSVPTLTIHVEEGELTGSPDQLNVRPVCALVVKVCNHCNIQHPRTRRKDRRDAAAQTKKDNEKRND